MRGEIEYLCISSDHRIEVDTEILGKLKDFTPQERQSIQKFETLLPNSEIVVRERLLDWEKQAENTGTFHIQKLQENHHELWNELLQIEYANPVEAYHYFRARREESEQTHPTPEQLSDQLYRERRFFYKKTAGFLETHLQEAAYRRTTYLALLEDVFVKQTRETESEHVRLAAVATLGLIRNQKNEWENRISPSNYPSQIGRENLRNTFGPEEGRWITKRRYRRS